MNDLEKLRKEVRILREERQRNEEEAKLKKELYELKNPKKVALKKGAIKFSQRFADAVDKGIANAKYNIKKSKKKTKKRTTKPFLYNTPKQLKEFKF